MIFAQKARAALWLYLPLSVFNFILATFGSDVFAQMTIGGVKPSAAFRDHAHWAIAQPIATAFLLTPFVLLALLCAGLEKDTRRRSIMALFAVCSLLLLYFYFRGYSASQLAMLDKRWTAASLAIGFLPFKGVFVLMLALGGAALAHRFDARKPIASGD